MSVTLIPDTITAGVTDGLDRLEAALPTVPARVLRLQRTAASAYCERTAAFWSGVGDATKSFVDTARVSGKTVVGQARAAATDVAETTRTGAATVAGQARTAGEQVTRSARTGANRVGGQASAQGRKVAETAQSAATKVVDDAIDAIDEQPGSGTPYEQWTKAQLVERAAEVGVPNRARMSKAELIRALRAS
jgi:hypothetical protein